MQTALTFDTKKLNLMQSIMAIDTEEILDKMASYLQIVSKKVTASQPLSAEAVEMMEQSRKEYSEGKVLHFESSADAQKWLESL